MTHRRTDVGRGRGVKRQSVTSECRESEEVEEEEGSRMVFFGQLRELKPDSWSATVLALRDEQQGGEKNVQQERWRKKNTQKDALTLKK